MQKIFGKYCRRIMTVCGAVLLCQPFQMKYLKFIYDAHCSFRYYEYNTENWCPIVIMRNRKLKSSIPNLRFPRSITVIQRNKWMLLMVNIIIWINNLFQLLSFLVFGYPQSYLRLKIFTLRTIIIRLEVTECSIEFFRIHFHCTKQRWKCQQHCYNQFIK